MKPKKFAKGGIVPFCPCYEIEGPIESTHRLKSSEIGTIKIDISAIVPEDVAKILSSDGVKDAIRRLIGGGS